MVPAPAGPGPAACPNSTVAPAAKLEQDVANAIRTELLSPEAVEFVVTEVQRGLREVRQAKPAADGLAGG